MEGGHINCVVARVEDDVVGFARWEGDGIAQVFVLPAWHGRGVAPLILAAAETKLKEQGHDRIWLQCQVGNARARRFYEKHGWHVAREAEVTVGTMEGRKPQLVWRMEKVLDRSTYNTLIVEAEVRVLDNPETSHPVTLRKGMMPNVYADGLFYIGRVAECPRPIEPGEDGVATIWIECGAYPIDVWEAGKQFELRAGPNDVLARAVAASVKTLEK